MPSAIDSIDQPCCAPSGSQLGGIDGRFRAPRGAAAMAAGASVVAATVLAGLAYALATAPAVDAAGFHPSNDFDNDGLSDLAETILATNPAAVDSDGDGFSDLEEIARQTDPRSEFSAPSGQQVSMGQAAFVLGPELRLLTLIYVPNAWIDWSSLGLNMGLATPNGVIGLPPEVYAPLSTLTLHTGAAIGSVVLRLESRAPAAIFNGVGAFALFATLTQAPTNTPIAAAAMNIAEVGGVFAAIENAEKSVLAPRYFSSNPGSGPMLTTWPLVPPDDVPSAFTVGQICVQTTTEVGYVGATLEVLVDSSDCKSADGYCSPTCPFEVGSTKQLIDALALLGG